LSAGEEWLRITLIRGNGSILSQTAFEPRSPVFPGGFTAPKTTWLATGKHTASLRLLRVPLRAAQTDSLPYRGSAIRQPRAKPRPNANLRYAHRSVPAREQCPEVAADISTQKNSLFNAGHYFNLHLV
jgi:hypothetical protein